MLRLLALTSLLLLSAAPCAYADTNDADLADYKQRLLTLIRTFKANTTTAADIEATIGGDFTAMPKTKGWQRWRNRSSNHFKSLSFHHGTGTYLGEKPGTEPQKGEAHYEVQYHADFASSFVKPWMPIFTDESRCLTVSEFTAALTSAGLKITIETQSDGGLFPEPGELPSFVISATRPGIYLRAMPNKATLQPLTGSTDTVDQTRGCIQTVSIS